MNDFLVMMPHPSLGPHLPCLFKVAGSEMLDVCDELRGRVKELEMELQQQKEVVEKGEKKAEEEAEEILLSVQEELSELKSTLDMKEKELSEMKEALDMSQNAAEAVKVAEATAQSEAKEGKEELEKELIDTKERISYTFTPLSPYLLHSDTKERDTS